MKVVVIPNAGEILEVMRPYLWAEISDQEVLDLLNVLADRGFIVSHEVEVDDGLVVAVKRINRAASESFLRVVRPRRRETQHGEEV